MYRPCPHQGGGVKGSITCRYGRPLGIFLRGNLYFFDRRRQQGAAPRRRGSGSTGRSSTPPPKAHREGMRGQWRGEEPKGGGGHNAPPPRHLLRPRAIPCAESLGVWESASLGGGLDWKALWCSLSVKLVDRNPISDLWGPSTRPCLLHNPPPN